MTMLVTRIDLVAVGAASTDYQRLIDDYERRIGRHVRFASHEVKGEPLREPLDRGLGVERTRIDRALGANPGTRLVLLDSRGKDYSSTQLVDIFLGAPRLALVIGGAAGVHPDLRSAADHTVAFGRITMPHQLARLVATEQLYRTLKIARGEPYHH